MSAAGQAVVPCWNCDQVVQATATSCLWCGVVVRPTVTPIVVAPDGAAPIPAPAAPRAEPAPTTHHPSPAAASHAPYTPPPRAPKRELAPLSNAFAGTASSVGAQVGAFTIDVFAVAAIAVTVHLTVASGIITALALIESLVFMWVLEARTGLTVGHLLLRIRSSRAATPYSPGAGRALLRQTILNVGLLVGVVGAWVVAASGAWDASGQRRSFAARATGTRAVQQLQNVGAAPGQGAPAASLTPGRGATAAGTGMAAPRVVNASTLGAPAIEDSQSVSMSGHASVPGAHTTPQMVTSLDPAEQSQPEHVAEPANDRPHTIAPVPGMAAPQAPSEPLPTHAADLAQAIPAEQVYAQTAQPHAHPGTADPTHHDAARAMPSPALPTPAQGGALLLVFDTGQRATLAMGTAINLGRKPSPVDPTDQLVAVEDPEGTVSKFHARLEHARGQTWVTDQGSTNGTDIVDEDGATRLEPGVRTLIDEGARARLGNRSFTVSVLLDPTPPPEIPT